MSEFVKKLVDEFSDKEYAHAYMESHEISRIAAQIHALRTQRGWSQQELARLSGLTQEKISKIESADFDSLTLKTLRKFSEAFDVHLHVAFVPFSYAILDAANLSHNRLRVPERSKDLSDVSKGKLGVDKDGAWHVINSTPISLRVVQSPPAAMKLNVQGSAVSTWQHRAQLNG